MHVAALYRHPIKSHGREAIDHVRLIEGQTMPWDRTWAVTHEATKFDANAPAWAHCRNFMIGARTPGVAGVWSKLDVETRQITLTHQDLDAITFCPDTPADVARFMAWVAPLCPSDRAGPVDIISAPDRGMTDSPYPSISIMNTASHKAVQGALDTPITLERWRGNIWLDDMAEWAECGWMDREVQIGSAVLRVKDPIERCSVTNTSPITGTRDTATLDVLKNDFGHQNFGIYAEVIQTGDIAVGDKARLI